MRRSNNAWVTFVLGEDELGKALLLGGSLRRVGTKASLVVITGRNFGTSPRLTEVLRSCFDLVVSRRDVADDNDDDDDDGLRVADNRGPELLLHAFSLVQFEKVAVLSPNMVVVANCDEIFEKEQQQQSIFVGENGVFDPSVMLIYPSLEFHHFIKTRMESSWASGGANWRKVLLEALQESYQSLGHLAPRYNVIVEQFGGGGGVDERNRNHLRIAIANFDVNGHPWDLWKLELKLGAPNFQKLLNKLVGVVVGLILSEEEEEPPSIRGGDVQQSNNNNWSGGAHPHHEPIAIVGMSFKLPGGKTETEFWRLLVDGGQAIKAVPPHRWNKDHSLLHCSDTRVEAGFLDERIDEFDAKFFDVNPKDAMVLDPQIRLLYEVSWEALEQGGIDPLSLQGSQTGIFVGSWMYNYRDLLTSSGHVEKHMFRAYMGNSIGAESARLSHFFGTTGPSISTESGCSSSIVAVHMGVKSLRARECNMALACGVNLLIHPFTSGMMEGVLAPDYRCKTFDAKADGFARAEGVATLVMKRLSDAVRDGDSIWGLIRGSAVVQEGHSKSLGTPTIHCEALAMELALKDAGVDGGDVSYVEAHGTGTAVGDPMEVAAITKAYKSQEGRTEPLVIGSVKTNVGHTESASGITSIVKVLLSMKHELIPPHLHLETLNSDINLEAIPAKIPLEPLEWTKSPNKSRIAGVSSFGITGTDGHVIIEEPPAALPANNSQVVGHALNRPLHLLKLSAKSAESFEALLEKYEKLLESTEENFEDICFSANTGRSSFSHRALILAKDCLQASKMLKEKTFKKSNAQGGGTGGALCFLFTGQGSQYPGMAKSLYESSPVFKMHFDRGADILKMKYAICIKDAMWGCSDEPTSELLNQTLYSQTSIFVVEYSLLKLWESWGLRPDYVMGHSLGEFAAAVASGGLTFEDALMLVAERSRLIDSLPQGKMLVAKSNKAMVDHTIAAYTSSHPEFWVDTAALNSHDQTVVAGDSGMIEEFGKYCEEEKKLKCMVLASTHAFHSRHMDPMLEEYGKIASTIRRSSPPDGALPPKYISGMEGKIVDVDNLDADYWVAHTRQKVSFMEACKTAGSEGISLFLEIGPHPVLSALTMMNLDGTSSSVSCLPSLRRNAADDWSVLLESLSKLYLSSGWKGSIDWKGFDRGYSRSRVPLPFYPFNKKSIWVEIRPQLPLLHPLLGRILPASTPQFIYEVGMSSKSAPYLEDHVIGNTVIFPGAGFLEMCLAAGYASAQGLKSELPKPRRPIALRDLKIGSPLALHESHSSILQTTVSLEEVVGGGDDGDGGDEGYPVTISRFCSDNNGSRNLEWTTHATARFHPILATSSSSIPPKLDLSPEEMQEQWDKSDNRDFYGKLPEVGLRFGPTFQSLECGWRGGGEEEGALFKVKVPQDHSYSSYLIHPVVADAMLQALMVWSSTRGGTQLKKKLQVPVCIGEFVWLGWSSSNSELYIYCSTTPTAGERRPHCHLMTPSGTLLASMGNVEFVETSAKLVEGMTTQSASSTNKGSLWEEVYRSSPGPLQNRLVESGFTWRTSLTPQLKQEVDRLAEPTQEESDIHSHCTHATTAFFLRALTALGWKPARASPFTPEELIQSLGIVEGFKPYLVFFLRSLAAQQVLEIMEEVEEDQVDQQLTFRFSREPPSPHDLDHWLDDSASKTSPAVLSARPDFSLLSSVGTHLAAILRGEVHPFSVLFPEDESKPSAKKFYEEIASKNEAAIFKINQGILDGFAKQAADSTATLRILEIGSGTGAASRSILELCKSNGLNFELHFTDISPAFFIAAEKEFGAKYGRSVVFKKYDMEEDPLSQGFSPGYFDVILAMEVLHIAKDVRRMLKRVRSLLRPRGLLQVIETVAPDETETFIFGLLDGYWTFEDLDFRRWHTILTPAMWETALTEAHYTDLLHYKLHLGVHGIFLCGGGSNNGEVEEEVAVLREVETPKHAWILFDYFYDNDEGRSTTMSPLAASVAGKLEDVNRVVHVFHRPVGLMSEAEFGKLLAEFVKKVTTEDSGVRLEGILYLWGLSEEEDEDERRRDQSLISLPFVTLCQLVVSLKAGISSIPSVYAVTQGMISVSGSQVLNPSAATLMGIVRCLNTEYPNLNISAIDLSPDLPLLSQADELFCNIWGDKLEAVLMREGRRLVPKFAVCSRQSQSNNNYLPLPNGCERFKLVLPLETKLISDLEFTFLDNYSLAEGEIEVEVRAVALNFRDVLVVLKPVPEFEDFNAIGLDVAGVVVRVGPGVEDRKVGDRVLGMPIDTSLALPSHLKTRADRTVLLPSNMTFAEGATLPAVFSTVYYCLVKVADAQRGETLLVHTASGGVGLCAIQFAKRLGVEVIATAGSNRKRTYLRNLGIKHVFNSRNTEYGQQILEVTGGRGVDIVLNSLTGPGFKEESLRALRTNGRFVEMSKLNVWSVEEVRGMRPDVSYTLVDLTTLGESEFTQVIDTLKDQMGSTEGAVQPLPYERFDALNIRGALNFLQKAKHVGKVVCIMPELKAAGKGQKKYHERTPLFNADSTYLVSGGLGGIGFEVVKWILSSGGKHVVVVSRNPPNPEVAAKIEALNRGGGGAHVVAFPVDVGSFSECQQLFEGIQQGGFPPLRGVMHAAGVLADATIEDQTWASFRHTYNPKVAGTWNLHELTKGLLLEHFLLFSSMSALFGSPGQANHAASNSFEDSFAHYRRSMGLPATSINWCNWGEVGVATELDFPGISPISTAQGIAVLEECLRTGRAQTAAINVDSVPMVTKLFPRLKIYMDDKRLLGDVPRTTIINSDEFWAEVDAAEEREDKVAIFKKHIILVTRKTLNLDPDEVIDDNAEFSSIGVDSLMMLEMKNSLQNVVGSRMTITASQVKDCTTPELLANRLVDLLEGQEEEKNLPTMEELRLIIKEDCVLPDHITADSDLPSHKRIDQVRTVLLTGVTGGLGPHMLRELVRNPRISKIYCLVRKFGKLSPSDRLKSALEKAGLLDKVDLDEVECLQGDMSQPSFGMDEEEYHDLAEKVDAVFHCAVLADHTAKYWRSSPDSGKCSRVRTANVIGTLRVLEFCINKRLKHLFHASSLVALNTFDESGTVAIESWQENDAFDNINYNSAYTISKFISEQLVKTAVERGLPCTALRLPLITGDSQTGRVDFASSHLHIYLLTILKLRCTAEIPLPIPHIPVDICARLCAQVGLHPEASGQVYNVYPRFLEIVQVVVAVAQEEFGIGIEVVSNSQFFQRLKAEPNLSSFDQFKKLYDNESFSDDFDFHRNYFQMYVSGGETSLNVDKISRIVPDFEERMEPLSASFRRDLKYLKAQGAFDKFGITSSNTTTTTTITGVGDSA